MLQVEVLTSINRTLQDCDIGRRAWQKLNLLEQRENPVHQYNSQARDCSSWSSEVSRSAIIKRNYFYL